MTEWHRGRRGDLGLRALGLGGCALSYLSIHDLLAVRDADPGHWIPDLVAYILTATGFLGASAGLAMIVLGAHLFDKVDVGERWRSGRSAPERAAANDFSSSAVPNGGARSAGGSAGYGKTRQFQAVGRSNATFARAQVRCRPGAASAAERNMNGWPKPANGEGAPDGEF